MIFCICKKLKLSSEKKDIYLIFAQNIDCGYMLEPPRRGGSNEYPQSMFWIRNKKKMLTPSHPCCCCCISIMALLRCLCPTVVYLHWHLWVSSFRRCQHKISNFRILGKYERSLAFCYILVDNKQE